MASLKLPNCPLSHLLLWLVLKSLALNSSWQLKVDSLRGSRDWESDYDLSRKVILRELGAHFDREAEPVPRLFIYERIDAEGSRVLSIDAVVHHEELTIRRIY